MLPPNKPLLVAYTVVAIYTNPHSPLEGSQTL